MSSVCRRIFFVSVFIAFGGLLWGQTSNFRLQPKNNSPYSRFGLGDFVNQTFAHSAAMGGLSAAYNDPFHLNVLNPASLAHLEATAFEVGAYARYAQLDNQVSTTNVWSGNLNYLALGFTLKNPVNEVLDRKRSLFDFGMSFSLMPYSDVGYNIETTQDIGEGGTTTNILKGSGGTTRVSWGNAVRYKDFSFGVDLGFQFGKITNSRLVIADSLQGAFTTELLDEISVRGLRWRLGAQYVYNFKKPDDKGELQPTGRRFVFGIYGNPATSFRTNTSRFYHRDNFSNLGILDTILYEEDIKQDGQFPLELTFGMTYERANKYRFGFEYRMANWSDYENEAKPEELSDTWRFSVGGEIIPDFLSYNSYLKRMRYRFGVFYGQDPRSFDGTQLTEYGISFGLGFPIIMPRQQTSFINLAVEAGRFGLSEGLQETFVKMTIGFTLNDNSWFFKRKFN